MPDAQDDDAVEAAFAPAALNPLFHEPARLAALSALAPAEYVEFATLLQITGVSKSALSKHLSALADAGVVEASRTDADKRGRRFSLTPQGRSDFNAYLGMLTRIVRNAQG